MKKAQIEKLCKIVNISPQKVYRNQKIYLATGVIAGILSYFVAGLLFGLLVFLALIFLFFYETIFLKRKADQAYKMVVESFANFVSYVLVLLENGFNVYQTLQTCKEYCEGALAIEIDELLVNINNDKTLTPFYNFALKFDSVIISQIMVMLHQLQNNGYESKYLHRFPPLIEKIRIDTLNYRISKRKETFSMYTVVPIIALISVIFIFVFSILSIFMRTSYV